jgi:ABC-2 type transport system permease protein
MGIVQPVLWLALLGKAMNIGSIIPSNLGVSSTTIMLQTFGTTDYFSFMAMGMVAFTTVFTTAFVGMSIVWDRRLGFMNKVLSTPVSRSVIILAKVLCASIRAMFQALIVTAVAFALGLVVGTNFGLFSLLGVFAIVFMLSVGLSSLFTALTLRTTSFETPQALIQLITLPLMFASNAYFPITNMPEWLQVVASVNPISYAIDAVRRLMIFSDGFSSLPLDFLYVGMFAVVVTTVCVVLSWRYLNK